MNYAILLSGGIGSRVGENRPKQYIEIQGRPLILFALDSILSLSIIDKVIIGLSDEWKDYVKTFTDQLNDDRILFSRAGSSREETTMNALKVIEAFNPSSEDIVVITEAARPMASSKLIEASIEGCKGYDGALPVIPVKETVYECSSMAAINSVPDRNSLYIGQSPEAFNFLKFLRAHEKLTAEELASCHGGAQLAFESGMRIRLIEGDEWNYKITTMKDLDFFEYMSKSSQKK